MLVFSRVGAAIMLLPGFGEIYIPARIRLIFAAMVSVLISPIIKNIPEIPDSALALFIVILAEITVGLFIGGISRILISTAHMAGMIISYQSSLASAVTKDVAQAQGQGTSLGNLIGVVALVLIFSTNIHHLMLSGVMQSYSLFLPGEFPSAGSFANHAVKTVGSAFEMAMKIASPHIVVGLMIYLGSGIVARLMPNMQVFFILIAPQLLISFFIFMISFSTMMLWYMEYIESSFKIFLLP